MRKVNSYEQIQEFMKHIRSLRKGFITNFYWDSNKHPYWLAEGTLKYEQGETCILLIHQNSNFSNLYYMATDFDAVATLLSQLDVKEDLIADIICKGDGEQELATFNRMGFHLYRTLFRMSHTGAMAQTDWTKDGSVQYGMKEDASIVHNILLKDFDQLSEQLPSFMEVEDFAERRQLSVIKDRDKLCGFLIAELTGVTWYLRYWYVSPNYRNQGVGAKLLHASWIDGIASKRQLLWVLSDNENAIKRYEHYGFSCEGMYDYIMIKRKSLL